MKITSDQIHGVRQAEQEKKPARTRGVGFDDVLAQETGTAEAQAKPLAAPPLLGMGAMLGLQAATAAAPETTAENTVMEHVESLLTDWEKYAENLGTPGDEAGLRKAYAVLEKISGDVKRLKEEMPDMSANPELKSLVDELEIMTVTETIKFNRGDYL